MADSISSYDINTPLCSPGRVSDDIGSVGGNSKLPRFYDPDATLEVKPEIAHGFLVLLTNGAIATRKKKSKKTKFMESDSAFGESLLQLLEDEEQISLAFLALTDGNIVDACFGIQKHVQGRPKNQPSPAENEARSCKEALRDAADMSDIVRFRAIEAYRDCFRVVIEYNEILRSLGMASWCLKHCSVRTEATERLEEAFKILEEAVTMAS
mmetsp:Transcript_9057/g.12539  ORF Transcript_9057/g.12539 Transcript_9057/m.12539 type:complete len:211 (-) Transcript_9057:194-826(-)|eukprot:CAMPEP_0185732256 /NCGR_PEP_ID=MMETSP1171-20130828/15561_1 /TAXON_ID=374046 /ORGANISM="Helicotheca tamensis, Strain CCMP826" /LENGTH=210 /DNA_ID=CAMNT_0028401701 /DNA_START=60 /DNA_END=692 /DNA_ORIENTATION=+